MAAEDRITVQAVPAVPLISVVMPVFNGAEFVRQAIDSILTQSLHDFELVIVDDGSTDQTADLVRAYSDPRIVLLRNESNIGLTKSLNRGIKAARGKFIARQDADDMSLPDRLARQAEYLAIHPEVALVGAGSRWIDADGQLFRESVPPTEPAQIQQMLLYAVPFLHGTFMLRRDSLRDVDGGYNEAFPVAQDYDLLLRLSERWELANLIGVLYVYRVHSGSVTSHRKLDQERYGDMARQAAIRRRLNYGYRRLGLSTLPVPDWVRLSSRAWLAQRYVWWSASARMLRKTLALKFLMIALLLDPLNRTAAEYLMGVATRKLSLVRSHAAGIAATVSPHT